jgi:hypothetical protein
MTMPTVYELIADPTLSWKAKGLALAMAMHKDELKQPGKNKIDTLVRIGNEKEFSVRSGIRELERAGAITINLVRSKERSGQITGSSWDINIDWGNENGNRNG